LGDLFYSSDQVNAAHFDVTTNRTVEKQRNDLDVDSVDNANDHSFHVDKRLDVTDADRHQDGTELWPGVGVAKLSSPSLGVGRDKLVCLSTISFKRLVLNLQASPGEPRVTIR
jgi:hypothetical protein